MTKYDSKFERELHKASLKGFIYHPKTIKFDVTESYTPDFGFTCNGFTYYIESKGYIYSSHGARILREGAKNLGEKSELIFLFQDPSKELKWQKKRKDGTRMSLLEWSESNNFRWFCRITICVLIKEIKQRLARY